MALVFSEGNSLKCLQGEPNSGIVNPFACYIVDFFTVNAGEKLTFESETKADEILWLNFWIPKFSNEEPNNITEIPTEIFELFPNLQSLSLTARIKTVHKTDLQNAHKLQNLLLANNELESIPALVFSAADNLEKLDLSFNRIHEIQDNAFAGSNKLKYLYLQRNALTKITRNAFSGLPKLRSLILDHNEIEEIEDGAFNLPNLKELGINKNKLKILSDNMFLGTPLLYKLQIKGNKLTHIGQSLYNLNGIEYISLENNQIEDVDLAQFAKLRTLEYLFLENNGHPFDNSSLFEVDNSTRLQSTLKYLIISGNKLSNSEILQDLSHLNLAYLERLDLDGNEFQRINFDDLKQNFPKLITIDMGVNKWSCEWLSDTFEKFEKENIDVTLFSSRFPFRTGMKQVRFIQCV